MLRCVKLVLNALIIAYCFIVETFIDKPESVAPYVLTHLS